MQDQLIENDIIQQSELPNFCPKDGYRFQKHEIKCQVCLSERLSVMNDNKIKSNNLNQIKKSMPERKWKKVLYERQPFEDNYLDSTFLDSLISTGN